jgi:hypothetical protein
MANIFEKSKKAQVVKTVATKDAKPRVNIEDPTFFDKVARLQFLLDEQKKFKAESDMIADEIKDLGKSEYVKLYERSNKNPETIMVSQTTKVGIAQGMVTTSDAYLKIDDKRATYLTEKYNADIVNESTTFSFDATLVEKYGQVISDLIETSTDIEDDDKDKIIKAVTSYSIAKGTIDKLKDFSKNIAEVYEDIRPIVSLKTPEIIKTVKS